MSDSVDPEMRGAAAVQAAQATAAVVTTVAGAVTQGPGKAHANNLNTPKPARGYALRDKATGNVLKYGETTLGERRYSRTYLKEIGAEIKFEAKGTKREMHDWQHEKILEYKANNGGKRPPLNKSDY